MERSVHTCKMASNVWRRARHQWVGLNIGRGSGLRSNSFTITDADTKSGHALLPSPHFRIWHFIKCFRLSSWRLQFHESANTCYHSRSALNATWGVVFPFWLRGHFYTPSCLVETNKVMLSKESSLNELSNGIPLLYMYVWSVCGPWEFRHLALVRLKWCMIECRGWSNGWKYPSIMILSMELQ